LFNGFFDALLFSNVICVVEVLAEKHAQLDEGGGRGDSTVMLEAKGTHESNQFDCSINDPEPIASLFEISIVILKWNEGVELSEANDNHYSTVDQFGWFR
jgi:hypothetical protein